MTLHVDYTHECEQCAALYIPYDADVPCPRCGLVEIERFDYIPQAVDSLRFNLESSGSYTPDAWWIGSLGDHVLSLLFMLLDAYELEQPETPFALFIDSALSQMRWGEQDYLQSHIRGIALRIREELDKK